MKFFMYVFNLFCVTHLDIIILVENHPIQYIYTYIHTYIVYVRVFMRGVKPMVKFMALRFL